MDETLRFTVTQVITHPHGESRLLDESGKNSFRVINANPRAVTEALISIITNDKLAVVKEISESLERSLQRVNDAKASKGSEEDETPTDDQDA